MNRNDELTRVLERIVWIGLRGGWTDVHSEEWQHEIGSLTQTIEESEPKPNDSSDPNASASS